MPSIDANRLKHSRHHARVLADLRQGSPVVITDNAPAAMADGLPAGWLVLALDTGSEAEWRLAQGYVDDDQQPALLISVERATLIATGELAAPEPMQGMARDADQGIMLPVKALPGLPDEDCLPALVETLRGLAGLDDARRGEAASAGMLGLPAPAALNRALRLLKTAFLIPAALVWPLHDKALAMAQDAGLLTIDAVQAGARHDAPTLLASVVEARVPLSMAANTSLHVYRAVGDGREHVAIAVHGADAGGPKARAADPLVRLHAACFTGDLLGSLRCDCGDQLRGALALMAEQGGGILLYLAQEGRDIGLINKLRAYRLQDDGLDTIDANLALGFAADERDYGIAAAMLKDLLKTDGQPRIRLLTNNPDKIAQLEAAGVTVSERIGHHFPPNPHNRTYIATKHQRAGHFAD